MHPPRVFPFALALFCATAAPAGVPAPGHVPGVAVTLGVERPGLAAGQQFGFVVAGAGDFNADGFADWIATAPVDDADGVDVGLAYVFFGGATPDDVPDLVLHGEGAGDKYGESAAALGDFDGDGFDDIILGADGNDSGGLQAGRAYVYFGGPAADAIPDLLLTGEAAGDFFGFSCAAAGDLNGDGFRDAAVGAPLNDRGGSNAGAVFVYYGGPGADATPDLVLVGLQPNDQMGRGLDRAGDVDGDGFDDLAAGAPYHDTAGIDAGAAWIWLCGPGVDAQSDRVLDGEAAGDAFGWPLRGAGDVDRDGFDDLAVSAPLNDARGASSGAVYVYRGGALPDATPDWIVRGQDAGATLGVGLGAGDVNEDGCDDLLVGAPFNIGGAPDAGHGLIYYGGVPPDTLPDETLPLVGGRAGNSIAWAGDVRGDGFGDVVLGAFHDPALGPQTGRAALYDIDRYHLQSPPAGVRAEGTVRVVWNGAEPADLELSRDGGAHFARLGTGVGGQSFNLLDVTPGPPASSRAVVRVVPSDPSVSGEARSGPFPFTPGPGGRMLAVWPSPARSGAPVQISMGGFPLAGAAVRVEISLFDLAGRRVATIADGALTPLGGVAQVAWEARGSGVRSGVYVLRAVAPAAGLDATARIVILE